jgi:NAD-dependent deacetylase
VRAVITQNIDRLHGAAGSDDVIEVHGSIAQSVCLDCGGRVPLERVVEMIERDPQTAPECSACVSPLKPDVVLFGEFLPEDALRRAHDLAAEADLMIAIGSSLEVHPVASLPGITLANGGHLALVTQGPTPYDRDADVKLSGDVVDELEAVLAAV